MKRLLAAAALLCAVSAPTHAQILLATDTFDGEAGGVTALNYASFANWNVKGKVDVIQSGNAGITCAGGSGSCVDLDGGTLGGITSKTAFAFNAGDAVTVSWDLSGNQRNSNDDRLDFDLLFTTPTTWSSYTANFAGNSFGKAGPVFLNNDYVFRQYISASQGWSSYIFTFVASHAGSFQVSFGSSGSSGGAGSLGPDDQGLVIDNIGITKVAGSVVPEPATYALMLTGLAMLGGVARRRKARS